MIRNFIVGAVAAAAVAATATPASAGGYDYGHGYGYKSYGYTKSHYNHYNSCKRVFVGYKTKAVYDYGYVRYIEVPIYKKVCYNGYGY